MAGTFGGIGLALSALRHHQTAMDVASGNIANAGTEGYTRRRAIGETVGAGPVPALWSRWNGADAGVMTAGIDRITDPLLVARSRDAHAESAFRTDVAGALRRVEDTMSEPGENGLSRALEDLSSAWNDLASTPGDPAARAAVLAAGRAVAATVNRQASGAADEWATARGTAGTLAVQANALATELAGVNRALSAAGLAGADQAGLLDQRDQVLRELTGLVGGTVTLAQDGTATVAVGGRALVAGREAHALAVSGAATLGGSADAPVAVTIGGEAATVSSGRLGAAMHVLGTEVPGHVARLDAVVADLAGRVNALHQAGYGSDGVGGRPFFSGSTAADLAVAVTTPDQLAATTRAGSLGDETARALADLDISSRYHGFVTDVGARVAAAGRTSAVQATLAGQLESSRQAVSGVSIDEETVNLLASQRAYEAAARVLTTLDSVLDTLINRTGVTR